MKKSILLLIAALPQLAMANPYFNPRRVPLARTSASDARALALRSVSESGGSAVLRVQVDWNPSSEAYTVGSLRSELSGTPALITRTSRRDPLGSYHGTLLNAATGAEIAHQSMGTGQEYRKLVRTMAFRFPMPTEPVLFRLEAENPRTGVQEVVLTAPIDPAAAVADETLAGLQVRALKDATATPTLVLNVYAEGYKAGEAGTFWSDAARVPDALGSAHLPFFENLQINAVFLPSEEYVGSAHDLSPGIHGKNTALGLYYPYWDQGGPFYRWYHVVYATDQGKFRQALGQAAYDYPVVLVNSGDYWGVGNYNEMTAIPSRDSHFDYLLTHEIGHFFGLNEEYEGGGGTELAFAPEIHEPWSQNLTFLRTPSELKWMSFVAAGTPLPTPSRLWHGSTPRYGAYLGGYGDTDHVHAHKPGLACVMDRFDSFCAVCSEAVGKKIAFDLGL